MIIWINGAFGAGKTTLTEQLRARRRDALVFDPEYVGYLLRRFVPVPTGDFQDLPSWRELVVETVTVLRRQHGGLMLVPMTLVNDEYFAQIVGVLRERGEDVLHVFLDLDPEVLRQRLIDRVLDPDNPEVDQQAREFGLQAIDRCMAAAARQPAETLMLRSDKLSPAELADVVLTRVHTA